MSESESLDSWMAARERRAIVLIASLAAGLLVGVAALAVLRQSPSSDPSDKSVQLWLSIPVVGLCWVALWLSLNSRLVQGVALAFGVGHLGGWILIKPEPLVIGDMIQKANSDLDILAFGAFLLTVMALIDIFVLSSITPKVLMIGWAVLFPAETILSYYLPGFYRSRADGALVAIWLLSITAAVWSVVVETVLLLAWETRSNGRRAGSPGQGGARVSR